MGKKQTLCVGNGKQRIGMTLTLPIYSDRRSWRAWRTELHSATMRSLRSSRVHEESAIRAAPLIMLSRRSSREGRKRSSLNASGSTMICFCKESVRREIKLGGKKCYKSLCYTDHLLSRPKERNMACKDKFDLKDKLRRKPKQKIILLYFLMSIAWKTIALQFRYTVNSITKVTPLTKWCAICN